MVEPEGEMQLQSPLAILLLHKFAWGRLAASEVQQFADTAEVLQETTSSPCRGWVAMGPAKTIATETW